MAAPVLHWPALEQWSAVQWIVTRDHRLMRRVNRWTPPRWLRLWMVAATRCGDGWLWYAMGLIIAITGGPERFRALLATVLAVSAGIALFIQLKRVCHRRRPCTLEPHCWATLLPPDQFSFPSGHTITAFAVAISLSVFYPGDASRIAVLAPFSVAVSRHHPRHALPHGRDRRRRNRRPCWDISPRNSCSDSTSDAERFREGDRRRPRL